MKENGELGGTGKTQMMMKLMIGAWSFWALGPWNSKTYDLWPLTIAYDVSRIDIHVEIYGGCRSVWAQTRPSELEERVRSRELEEKTDFKSIEGKRCTVTR